MRQLLTQDRARRSMTSREFITDLLARADVSVGGNSLGDIRIHDEQFYDRVIAEGSLGLGESYMDGWWDCDHVDVFFAKVLRARLDEVVKSKDQIFLYLRSLLLNMQSRARSQRVAQQHYNLGNEFYADMLDPGMHYTCAFYENAETLEEAQNAKCELVARKLMLQPEDSVLELGCGWGGFAEYAARRYGCRVTAYNIAEEQVRYARERCKGLDVEFVLDDYRSAKGRYDKIVSIGLFEHVGPKNYRSALALAKRCLKDNGLFLLHTIGRNTSYIATDPWIEKYIFPGGCLPSIQKLTAAAEGLLVLEHFHSFGQHYDTTLMAWYEKFRRNWHKHEAQYGDRFFRMWSYYLLTCAGAFRARRNQLWQFVFSKHGVAGGYNALSWSTE
ncbi:MAG: cyclopropane fatty acyl phospholipid synthase [Gammaproteobacteria bacterium]|nr:cyclopropane fatty acyl phospholipid synthase [Gammaproteobacteria bacterium]NIM72611.1 cyclopropane fatty acyl phospholipid synthase [Gammaproteobacteria bacterium]NIN37668.1 cyclopropane fatty acyl phospholipid synthase [Gammaproteobacteria bacterium]NIO24372.1 cyclopropane fatty acyl phospholipid synthase [Gammaproteobacteria bacterium]NIO64975.1 cyclopropane fatty acyl phospholipid synthase [Gammaproteobacteria bacterium]